MAFVRSRRNRDCICDNGSEEEVAFITDRVKKIEVAKTRSEDASFV